MSRCSLLLALLAVLALTLPARPAAAAPFDSRPAQRAHASRTAPVLVLTRDVLAGETVTASMVAVERRDIRRLPKAALSQPVEAVGQLAARTLVAGTVLRGSDLVRPQAVRRKDVVSLAARGPGMQARESAPGASHGPPQGA